MGEAGVRTMDNMVFFEPMKPLIVVYYDLDYQRNPKGSNYWRNRYDSDLYILSLVTMVTQSIEGC